MVSSGDPLISNFVSSSACTSANSVPEGALCVCQLLAPADVSTAPGEFRDLLGELVKVHDRELGILQAEVARLQSDLKLLEVRPDFAESQMAGAHPPRQLTAISSQIEEERSSRHADGFLDGAQQCAATDERFGLTSLSPTFGSSGGELESCRTNSRTSVALPFAQEALSDVPSSCLALHYAERFVKHPLFEAGFAIFILINAFVMAAEVQYNGIEVGVLLEYPGSHRHASDVWPGGTVVFEFLSWVFGFIFALEVILNLAVHRLVFFQHFWSWLDTILVGLWIIDRMGENLVSVNPSLLRLARLAKLARLIRLVRTIQGFDALYLMTTALTGSLAVLTWACALLFLLQMMLALLLNQVLQDYFADVSIPLEQRQEIYEYFGSCSRALLSMFEITLANWPPVCRLLSENVSEWFTLFCLLHKLTIGFAVVGVINGVFMQETFKVAATDDVIMVRQKEKAVATHAKKMKQLFAHADQSGHGFLSLQEFQHVVMEPAVQTWLASMELDTGDADTLYRLIDDGDGRLSADELIAGVAKLKGAARSIDMAILMRELLTRPVPKASISTMPLLTRPVPKASISTLPTQKVWCLSADDGDGRLSADELIAGVCDGPELLCFTHTCLES